MSALARLGKAHTPQPPYRANLVALILPDLRILTFPSHVQTHQKLFNKRTVNRNCASRAPPKRARPTPHLDAMTTCADLNAPYSRAELKRVPWKSPHQDGNIVMA